MLWCSITKVSTHQQQRLIENIAPGVWVLVSEAQ
jgi:hypothetical protein